MKISEILLESEPVPAAQILKYVKQIHPEGEFNIDHVITDHPFWTEADVPVSSLHIFDPEQDDIYDPYNRVQDTDLYQVDRLIPNIASILQNKPLVIDDAGYILDGNHRALAAQKAGLKMVPVWQPVKGQPGVAEHIVKVKGGYELKSKHGNKNLGKYPTRAGAEKRERQVQYFKHAGESVAAGDMKPVQVTGKELPGAVERLERMLLNAKQQGKPLDYDHIDMIMQKICHKHNLTGDKLHDDFVDKHAMVPDNWILKQDVSEAWSNKYKRSIDCSHPKGFSQKAHCAGRNKHS